MICERLVGFVSFKTSVFETAGQINLSDNVRCKMHQMRVQVKRTSRLRLKRKLKSV